MNVVWFVLDTLRADHLSCYGYFRETSPNIDRLTEEGILFEDSYASAIATGPGFTSLFTGLAAINHGFYLTPWNVPNAPLLDDRIVTLPELIQVRGNYTTAAFDNLINFRSHMKQFARGFEFYINITRSPAWLHHHVIADEVNHRLLPWLERHADEQFFAFVHYWDPHTPYNMPDKFRGKFDRNTGNLVTKKSPDGYEYVPGWGLADKLPKGNERLSIDLYDDEVFYTDYSIGLVLQKLEALDLLDETAIIVTSDHGEDLDLHGIWGHGTVHNTTIFVPLIIRDPKNLQGKRISGFVQHADNLPTILDYFPERERPEFERVSLSNSMPEIPAKFDGESLLKLARGERATPEEIVVESGQHRAYIAPPWKLIWHKGGQKSELFHFGNDPLELNNRADEEKAIFEELSEKLNQWVARNLVGKRADPIFATDGAWTCYINEKSE
ncbi:MAG: sulfatase [Candidatus Poribacteria bacterium]